MKIQLSDVSNTECKGYMASNEMWSRYFVVNWKYSHGLLRAFTWNDQWNETHISAMIFQPMKLCESSVHVSPCLQEPNRIAAEWLNSVWLQVKRIFNYCVACVQPWQKSCETGLCCCTLFFMFSTSQNTSFVGIYLSSI
jgi:hypothetical protein